MTPDQLKLCSFIYKLHPQQKLKPMSAKITLPELEYHNRIHTEFITYNTHIQYTYG